MSYKKQAAKISWNRKALAGISRKNFVATFSSVYPGANLDKEFDALFPQKVKTARRKKASTPVEGSAEK
jgi:hypothetical protein